jgi:hypothetical protein
LKISEFKKPAVTAAIVGVILSCINQFDRIISMTFTARDIARIVMNFLVPFLVATVSRQMAIKEMMNNAGKQDD